MEFKKQGFLIQTLGSTSRGFAKNGKPMFGAASENPEHAKIMTDYFDPALNIVHLVSRDHWTHRALTVLANP
jgi:hypothetical protein